MHQVRINPDQNTLYITLKGFLNDDEVKSAAAQIIKAADRLRPEFVIVNDIAGFSPTSPNAMKEIQRAQSHVNRKGVRRIIRLTGNVLSKHQFRRSQSQAMADYEVIEVSDLAEAKQYLPAHA